MHWELHEIRCLIWTFLENNQKIRNSNFPNPSLSTSLERNKQDLDHAFSLAKAAGAFITPEVANDFVVAISTTGREGGNCGIVAGAWGAWNGLKIVEGFPKMLIFMDKSYMYTVYTDLGRVSQFAWFTFDTCRLGWVVQSSKHQATCCKPSMFRAYSSMHAVSNHPLTMRIWLDPIVRTTAVRWSHEDGQRCFAIPAVAWTGVAIHTQWGKLDPSIWRCIYLLPVKTGRYRFHQIYLYNSIYT